VKKLDLLCVGNAVADTGTRPVESLPRPGHLVLVGSIGLTAGGCAINSAIGAARLGLRVGVGTAVGRDAFGDFLERKLKTEGVDTRGLFRAKSGIQSSASVVAISRNGERSFLHVIGASGYMSDRDFPDSLLGRFRALHLSGFFLLPRMDGAPARRLLRRALALGLATSLDTCWDPQGRWNLLKMCLPFAEYYLPSIEEARGTFGCRDPLQIARKALALGVRQAVVLKMGAGGCFSLERGGLPIRIPAFRVKAVDATGAGDSFDAGFLVGILRGLPLTKALLLGNAAGALSVSGIGGQGAIRNLRQAKKLAGIGLAGSCKH